MIGKHKVTQVDKKQFLRALQNATVEKDVENAYREIIQKYYGGTFTSPYSCDGFLAPWEGSLIENDKTALRLLLEAKWQKNFTDGDRIKLIAQSIFYMKKFKDNGDMLPNVIIGGDENEMFTLYAPKLYKYLDGDYNWSLPPSSAYTDEKLYRELMDDDNVADVFVFRIDKDFDINEVFESVNALCLIGEFKKLKVDEANLRKVFDEFVRLVFGGNEWLRGVQKIGATEAVSIFIQSILGNDDIYIHPNKPNVLVNGQQEIKVKGSAYNAFFSRYDRKNYTVAEKDLITSIADQLIKEIERRFHGDFWTPTIWADEAIKMMTEDLGPNWRNEYVVWDPAAGTKNLTRDYEFKNLFTSTLHQSEIDMSAQYNKNAISFQYDFLNDDIDVSPDSDPSTLKMPRELFETLKADKPIVFYTNPPYGQATNAGATGTSKAGISENKIARIMRGENLGHATLELYTQFIYRVQKIARDFHLSNVFFFFFNKGFLVSPAFERFTDKLLDQFEFRDGFMLNAGEFQGTSSAWGIMFSNFCLKKEATQRQESFRLNIMQSADFGVEKIGEHLLRRVSENDTISSWLREIKLPKKELNGGKYPQMSGAFTVSKGDNPRGRMYEGAIGYMVNNADNVQESERTVSLQSTSAYRANGTCVTVDSSYRANGVSTSSIDSVYRAHGFESNSSNFERACVTYACRKSILPDKSWINDKDTFRRPSDGFQQSDDWCDFVHDCVVYTLFHSSAIMVSLRDFEYNGETYDVKNEWFFMSKSEIIELATKYNLSDIVYDARSSEERFVYKYLHTENGRKINLSEEARELLLAGEEFVRVCFKKRFMVDQDHPEWHLMTWDAGYYQSYKIYTENKDDSEISEAYKKLDEARTKLETKIRHQVYKDGILSK